MSFSSKITSSDLTNKGVIGLPDTPGLSTSAMQNKLEETVRTVAIPKHNDLIDELESYTAADSIGAVAPTGLTGTSVQALINDLNVKKENNSSALPTTYVADATDTFSIRKLTDTYKIAFSDLVTSIKTAIGNATTSVSGLFSDTDKTKLDGIEPGAQVNTVDSVNSKTGAVVLTASDVGALPDSVTVPTKTSDLTNDSNFATTSDVASAVATKSTVSYTQTYTQAGQKIGEITIDGVTTDLKAPSGGSPGTGAVDSVNGYTGTVVLGATDVGALPSSTSIPSKVSDLTNDSGFQTSSDVSTAISTAIGALDGTVSGSAGAGKTLTAFSETDGKVSATFGDISITKSQISDLNGSLNLTVNGVQSIFEANQSGATSVTVNTPSWHTNSVSGEGVVNNNQVTFYNINSSYAYDLYCDGKLLGISAINTATPGQVTYTVTGASNNDQCYLLEIRR